MAFRLTATIPLSQRIRGPVTVHLLAAWALSGAAMEESARGLVNSYGDLMRLPDFPDLESGRVP